MLDSDLAGHCLLHSSRNSVCPSLRWQVAAWLQQNLCRTGEAGVPAVTTVAQAEQGWGAVGWGFHLE